MPCTVQDCWLAQVSVGQAPKTCKCEIQLVLCPAPQFRGDEKFHKLLGRQTPAWSISLLFKVIWDRHQ